jgi:hypothetical protein
MTDDDTSEPENQEDHKEVSSLYGEQEKSDNQDDSQKNVKNNFSKSGDQNAHESKGTTDPPTGTGEENEQRGNDKRDIEEYEVSELTDEVPIDQVIATISTALGSSDRDIQSDLFAGLTTSVLQDWTRAFDHVRPGVSVEREDNARLQQVRRFYETQQGEYEQLAAELGIGSYRGLSSSQVLFMTDLRRLQETIREELPTEPNADAVRLAELFNDRIKLADTTRSDAESVLSGELSDLRGQPIGEQLHPENDAHGYSISDSVDPLRTALVHRCLPIANTDPAPEPGDIVFLHANGDVDRKDISIETEGYFGCVILGSPVTGDHDWFPKRSDSATIYSFRRLYLTGEVSSVDFSQKTESLSSEMLEDEVENLLANAARVGESVERSKKRADQLDETEVVTESIVLFRTLRPDLVEVPAVVVARPFDGWISPKILSKLYFPDGQGVRALGNIESALRSGKKVILTGPPGTGKTEIGERVLSYLVSAYPNYYTGSRTTTATADWSTFDTIGGYMPNRNSSRDELNFDPGLITRCLRDTHTGRRLNEPLLIDELNRADIDKAFGQLFTALTSQSVELPFRTDEDEPLRIETPAQAGTVPDPEAYLLPRSWSLIATINSYDKTSLYEMSYAFMRRFSFVHINPPTIPTDHSSRNELLTAYANTWGHGVDIVEMEGASATAKGRLLALLGEVWLAVNSATNNRDIGPAIIKDMLETTISHRSWKTEGIDSGTSEDIEGLMKSRPGPTQNSTLADLITDAVIGYVIPQLEGLPEREDIAVSIAQTSAVNQSEIVSAVRSSLNLPNFTVNDPNNNNSS